MASQSRKNQIPGTLVLNWQAPDTQTSKPTVRRPMTACEACRTAKVKCNGQRACERCRNRGLLCSYRPLPNSPSGANNQERERHGSIGDQSVSATSSTGSNSSSIQTLPPSSLSTSHTTPEKMSIDMTGDPFSISESASNMMPFSRTGGGVDSWGEETFNHALEEFDWVFPASDIALCVCHRSSLVQKALRSLLTRNSSQMGILIRWESIFYRIRTENSALPIQPMVRLCNSQYQRSLGCLPKYHYSHTLVNAE